MESSPFQIACGDGPDSLATFHVLVWHFQQVKMPSMNSNYAAAILRICASALDTGGREMTMTVSRPSVRM